MSYRKRGEQSPALQQAINAASLAPIIIAFNVEAEGKRNSAVIEVSSLLTSDVAGVFGVNIYWLRYACRRHRRSMTPRRLYSGKSRRFRIIIEARSDAELMISGPPPLPKTPTLKPRSPVIPEGVRSLSVLVHYKHDAVTAKADARGVILTRVSVYFAENFRGLCDERKTESPRRPLHYPLPASRKNARKAALVKTGQTDRVLSQPGNSAAVATVCQTRHRRLE